MKILFPLLIVGMLLILNSCKKEDTNATPGVATTTPASGTVLSGKIDGIPWTFKSGRVNTGPDFFDPSINAHGFIFTDSIFADTCNAYGGDLYVSWTVDDLNTILQTGNYNDLGSASTPGIGLIHYVAGTPNIYGVLNGYVKVDVVDTVTQVVSGSIDATGDADNYISGTFSLKYCNW